MLDETYAYSATTSETLQRGQKDRQAHVSSCFHFKFYAVILSNCIAGFYNCYCEHVDLARSVFVTNNLVNIQSESVDPQMNKCITIVSPSGTTACI